MPGVDFMRSSKHNVFDVGAELGTNWLVTNKVAESPDLRWTWGPQDQPTSAFRDYRLAAGLGGHALNVLVGGTLGRGAADVGSGLLHSFVTTETLRAKAIGRVANPQPQGQQQMPGGQQPQFSNPVPPPGQQQQPAQGVFARFRTFLPGSFA